MGFDYAAKIQALLANADDEALSDAARDAYRTKAQEWMIKYRTDEETALATDPGSSAPISRVVTVCRPGPMAGWYTAVLATITRHAEVRAMTGYDNGMYHATLVGYEGDVRYAEFLWTSALLMFVTRIDPTWDDDLTPEENIYRLRSAGIERRVIADRAWGNGHVAAARSRVQRIYLRECANRGETARATGLSHDTATYRTAYARSFADTLERRLRRARDAANSAGGAMVMHGREERVNEAFYTLFPSARPSTEPVPAPAPCAACARATSGTCRAHTYRWTKSDEARYQRLTNSPSAHAGASSGVDAANGIDLVRGTAPASRVDHGVDRPELDG